MIRPETIKKLRPPIDEAVIELFDYCIEHQSNKNDFILFLENGHYSESVPETFNNYVVGIGEEGIMDFNRLGFFEIYANTPFYERYQKEKDDGEKKQIFDICLNLEMMIYTHFWEAYTNLKTWKQLTNLALGKDYEWKIDIPYFGKQEFIRKSIRDVFKEINLKITDIISDCYNSQLRNAFAHSQYSFFYTDKIKLGNYTGKAREMKEISLDDWEYRFTSTSLLYDSIMRKKQEYKTQIGSSREKHSVWIPYRNGHKLSHLAYDKTYNRFYWYQNKET